MKDEHGHSSQLTHINRAFKTGIALNLIYIVVEVIAGFWMNSLALLSDAGHNLSDVASLALSLLAFKLAQKKSTTTYSYGYRKTTIMAALFNAILLLVAMGAIAYAALHRFSNPQPLVGNWMAIVAGIGILINAATAMLFFRDKEKDLNIKGAYLHMAADALVSLAVVIAGVVIFFTDWYWLDPAISLAIAAVILIGTWGLLKDSLMLSLDAVPKNVDVRIIREKITSVSGIKEIHHLHIWAISTTEAALTVHLVLEITRMEEAQEIKRQVRSLLSEMHINHVTLEIEKKDEKCEFINCPALDVETPNPDSHREGVSAKNQ